MCGSKTVGIHKSRGRIPWLLSTLLWVMTLFGGVESLSLQAPTAALFGGAPSLAVLSGMKGGAFGVYPTLAGSGGGQDLSWNQFVRGSFGPDPISGQWGNGALQFESDLDSKGFLGVGLSVLYESLADNLLSEIGVNQGTFRATDTMVHGSFRFSLDLDDFSFDLTKGKKVPLMPLTLGVGAKLLIQDFGQTLQNVPLSAAQISGGLFDIGLGFEREGLLRIHTVVRDISMGLRAGTNFAFRYPLSLVGGVSVQRPLGIWRVEGALGWESVLEGTNVGTSRNELALGADAWVTPSSEPKEIRWRRLGFGAQARQDFSALDRGFGAGFHLFGDLGSQTTQLRLQTSAGFHASSGVVMAFSAGLHWEVGP